MRDKTGRIDISRLDELIPILEKDERIVLAFLFGSYALGKATSLSDVDIALLLSSETPRDDYLHCQLQYSNLVSKMLHDNRVDVVILNVASPLLAHEAIKGRVLFERSQEARVKYVVDVQRRFLDLKSFYAIDFAYMHRRLEEGTFGKP